MKVSARGEGVKRWMIGVEKERKVVGYVGARVISSVRVTEV